MQTTNLGAALPSWQPLHVRVWRHVDAAAQAVWHAIAQHWQEQVRQARLRREWRALAGLDPNILKDIGAPDWMVADAADRALRPARTLSESDPWGVV